MRTAPHPERLLTFRSGGWVLLLTALLAVGVTAGVLLPALQQARNRPPGDGRAPGTYGFDLGTCLVPRETLAAAQLHRDVVAALVDPPTMSGASVAGFNRERRGKYLVPNDRVIGVSVGGAARAYPLQIMASHGVANDTLGDRPIAVTYDPLCDSVVVVDREVRGRVLEFGVSGLVSNSNLLLYDRRPDGGESLWSQLGRRAVTGPLAGCELELVPATLTHWDDWLTLHPTTTVLAPDETMMPRYQETNYAGYYRSREIVFPVHPLSPADGPAPKTPCVVAWPGDDSTRRGEVFMLPDIAEGADERGRWHRARGGVTWTFQHLEDPEAVRVTIDGAPAPVVHSLWFAWHAVSASLPDESSNPGEPEP